ncbi:diaminopropionate ammonia-lyase [Pseudaminobacter sp. 19-2017]|uniref:Diaminopropionate ammonia-lyase n=1 Tax=Pseudaminobacter soli (ex Zhang et al. 2022) TaxID=2831468 RepID=A0A942I3Q0_9HYPH|nr:diaminopropionate ammonia-lyase [Pseudaminobacter soli]MBS3651632.1 diaminopropionate ammonia-lyase [Pseudaminobacter soli]
MAEERILQLAGQFKGSAMLNARIDANSSRLADLSGFTADDSRKAKARIGGWPQYQVTPLHRLPGAAARLGLGALVCKDESRRLGLASFKALGAVFAAVSEVLDLLAGRLDTPVSDLDLLQGKYREALADVSLVCATDGNHGFSVASAARRMGCHARIYIPAGVSPGREQALRDEGAEVVRIDGIYDEAYEAAEQDANVNPGAMMISDSATPHYTKIPALCMTGYSVMAQEFVAQLGDDLPTHMMLTAGCGGLAAAMISSLHQLLGNRAPKFIIVEPIKADCVFASAVEGNSTVVGGDLETIMGGLSCAAVSHLAWPTIDSGAFGFVRIEDDAAVAAMRLLAKPLDGDPAITAGETGGAGLAGLLALCDDPKARQLFGLDHTAKVLVINCEGATDPEQYRKLVLAEHEEA